MNNQQYSLLAPRSTVGWYFFVLTTENRDLGPYWHDDVTRLLQICWSHIHNVNFLLYWIKITWLWRPLSVVHYPAQSSNQKMCTLWSERNGHVQQHCWIRQWCLIFSLFWTIVCKLYRWFCGENPSGSVISKIFRQCSVWTSAGLGAFSFSRVLGWLELLNRRT